MKNKLNKKKQTQKENITPGLYPIRWYSAQECYIAQRADCPRTDLKEISAPDDEYVQWIAETLLSIGGIAVIQWQHEDAKENMALLQYGQIMDTAKLKLLNGPNYFCHQNTAQLYQKNPKEYRIVSGFAIDATEMAWRAHSWLLTEDNTIIETTSSQRDVYYGAILNDKGAAKLSKRMLS